MSVRRPERWWGYHRLDDHWAARIVADAAVPHGALVLDVGAGTGALTAPLVAAGGRVVAIELDHERTRGLKERFRGEPVVVVMADATDLRLPREPFLVVANPPFAATTALIRRLLAPGSRLVRADLVVPRHVARRWTSPAAPAAQRWGSQFALSIGRPIPRDAFRPPATTSTVVLRIVARRPALRPIVVPSRGARHARRGQGRPRAPARCTLGSGPAGGLPSPS